jgi:hypothetical protein
LEEQAMSLLSRPTLRPLLFATLIACMLPAFAQQGIEKQMTPEEFKAAGLDKLSGDELSRLNAWLNRTITTESNKAAIVAKEQVEEQNRGFFNFGKEDPIEASMVDEFRGFGRGRQYTLDNGQVWQQKDSASLSGVRLSKPRVKITPALIGNIWYMSVQGYNTRAIVERVK